MTKQSGMENRGIIFAALTWVALGSVGAGATTPEPEHYTGKEWVFNVSGQLVAETELLLTRAANTKREGPASAPQHTAQVVETRIALNGDALFLPAATTQTFELQHSTATTEQSTTTVMQDGLTAHRLLTRSGTSLFGQETWTARGGTVVLTRVYALTAITQQEYLARKERKMQLTTFVGLNVR